MKINCRIKQIICFLIFVTFCNISFLSGQKLYQASWKQAGFVIGGGAVLLGGATLIEDRRGPLTEYDLALLDRETLFGIDSGTIGNFSVQAGFNSDHFKNGAFIAPLTLFLSKQGRENAKEIVCMYAEVLSFNAGLTGIIKSSIGRYRPYAYNPNVDLETKLSGSTRRSFFSGHVSHVASLSYLTANIFDDLYPDSDYKYAVWAGAIAAPAITGYLRVQAGRHFPTDVIAGYGVGALIGYFIPELHKVTRKNNVNVIAAENGIGLVYKF